MSNKDFDNSAHERLILKFLEYLKHNQNYERRGSFEASVKARNALRLMVYILKERRDEIHANRLAYREQKRQERSQNRKKKGSTDDT